MNRLAVTVGFILGPAMPRGCFRRRFFPRAIDRAGGLGLERHRYR